MKRRTLLVGLTAVASSLAPAPQDVPTFPVPIPAPAPVLAPGDLAALASSRADLGVRAFDMAWLYYSENRVDSEKVYRWSRRLFEAQTDAATDGPGRVAAAQAHLDRIARLEAKIARIRKIGFGDSLDVVEVRYYRREAEFWVGQARSK